MIIEVGTKPNDVTLSWENLYAYNRKILDSTSSRYFFVAQPIELKVIDVPRDFLAKLPLHPEKPEKGFREYTIKPEGDKKTVSLWISGKDAQAIEINQVIRLIELFNIRIRSKTDNCVTAVFESASYEEVRKIKVQLIQWVLKGNEYPTQVINQDASATEGFAEADCKKLKPDEIIQFERFGFVHVTEVGPKLVVYYSQK